MEVPEDTEAQCALAWRNLQAQLRAAGMEIENLVKIATIVRDPADVAKVRAGRAAAQESFCGVVFNDWHPFPARPSPHRRCRGPAPGVTAIAAIHLTARRQAMPCLRLAHTDGESGKFARVVASRPLAWWVVPHQGQVVAYMLVDGEKLDHLYVAPGWQGFGFGSALVAKAKTLKPRRLVLWTFQRNERARQFYEAHGFRSIAQTEGENRKTNRTCNTNGGRLHRLRTRPMQYTYPPRPLGNPQKSTTSTPGPFPMLKPLVFCIGGIRASVPV